MMSGSDTTVASPQAVSTSPTASGLGSRLDGTVARTSRGPSEGCL
ncbi:MULTISPECIES: hypothetical protein [Haloferax]|nr:hypothetical protein [Haloferax mediterranei]MDX5989319.1 hypothetical protein [Haloferax mediterranei ATCC 33500]